MICGALPHFSFLLSTLNTRSDNLNTDFPMRKSSSIKNVLIFGRLFVEGVTHIYLTDIY